MVKTLVIALGGNALIKKGQKGTMQEQMRNLDRAMGSVARLARRHRIVIVHGNGSQVGEILLQQELGRKKVPPMPLQICVAESQGLIGYMIQDVLYGKLHKRGIGTPVVTVVTQVLVDPNDRAFRKPTKPIGPFYKSGFPREWKVVKTPRGFRRVVPSPEPKRIMEAEAIDRIAEKAIVIACGGGGVPVVKTPKGLKGVEAVIDKDLTAALLARAVGADSLVILTDVPNVFLNYGRKGQEPLRRLTVRAARELLKAGEFPEGSMGPKVKAAVSFLESCPKGRVVITDLDSLEEGLRGRAGTLIVKN